MKYQIRNILSNLKFRCTNLRSEREHIFILGCPRSGTTLLKTLLVAHSKIGGILNESSGIFNTRDIYAYKYNEFDADAMSGMLRGSKHIIEFYDEFVTALLKIRTKLVFTDKIQPRAYRLLYVSKRFPNARFIHIVRDGRDSYCSALRHPDVKQSSSLRRFAKYWDQAVKMPENFLINRALHVVRYEDLTNKPMEVLPEIMTFLKLDFEGGQLDPSVYSVATHERKQTVHANLNKAINTTSQLRWRKELSIDEIDTFNSYAQDALAMYNYELD